MKILFTSILTMLVFFGCSSDNKELSNVEAKLVVGKNLSNLNLKDQFEKTHKVDNSTKKVIFALSKDMAHICNDYFETQDANYLAKNNTLFVADISAAPSLIRSMFILPGIKDFKHPVILLDDKKQAAPYRAKIDVEKIIIVHVNNSLITKIETITTAQELKNIISN